MKRVMRKLFNVQVIIMLLFALGISVTVSAKGSKKEEMVIIMRSRSLLSAYMIM